MYFPRTGTQILTTFTANTASEFIEYFRQCLVNTHWQYESSENGYTFNNYSPQREALKLYIKVTISAGRIVFRFGSLQQSKDFYIGVFPSNYQVWANQCQVFVSIPGTEYNYKGTSVCCGIPYLPNENKYDEIWWCSGDGYNSPFFPGLNFRSSILEKAHQKVYVSPLYRQGYIDNSLCDIAGAGTPRILTLTPPFIIDYYDYLRQEHSSSIYYDGTPIYIPACVAWGNTNVDAPKIRGVLWDSIVMTKAEVMDRLMYIYGDTFINYTHEYYYGSLLLLIAEGEIQTVYSNYAY